MMPPELNRFRDEGCKVAAGLAIDVIERIVQFREVIVFAVSLEARPVRERRGYRERTDGRGTDALSARAVSRGRGITRHAVPRLRKANDLVLARDQLRHADGGLVRLGARAEQQRPVESIGCDPGEPGRQVDHRPREHPAEKVVQLARVLVDDRHDVGVAMPEDGTHLSRGEVEDRAAVRVVDETALGTLDDHRLEGAAIANQVLPGVFPKECIVVPGHCASPGGLAGLTCSLDGVLVL